MGHSSPGYLQLGQVPSNAALQIPQRSSEYPCVAKSQCQKVTACQSRILTFMRDTRFQVVYESLFVFFCFCIVMIFCVMIFELAAKTKYSFYIPNP